MMIYRKWCPPPIQMNEVADLLRESGRQLGTSAAICGEPMFQVDGVFLDPWATYRLAVQQITFEEALNGPSTVIPGVKAYRQPRVEGA